VIFVFPITIPANTPQANPIITPLQLTAGTITDMEIQVPSGVVALAHIQLKAGLYQLFPSNPEASFATSNETIDWTEEIHLDQPPYQLVAWGWNDDTSFAHTLTVRVVMQRTAALNTLAAEVASLLGSAGSVA
jgi:hypothetical protein